MNKCCFSAVQNSEYYYVDKDVPLQIKKQFITKYSVLYSKASKFKRNKSFIGIKVCIVYWYRKFFNITRLFLGVL
jgi:hypothetical protein